MLNTDPLMFALNGGRTKRFHTVEMLKENTVGHHSFNVAWFAWYLCEGNPSLDLIMACLAHDIPEHLTGDIPAPTKRAVPGIKAALDDLERGHLARYKMDWFLKPEEEKILKYADIFDGMHQCILERKLGNKSVEEAYKNFYSYAQMMQPTARPMAVLTYLNNLWRQYNE